mgnify:CR=1 FL=1
MDALLQKMPLPALVQLHPDPDPSVVQSPISD